VRADEPLAPLGALDDEAGLFEHRHVLLDRGERHVVVAGEFGDGLRALARPAQAVSPGRRRPAREPTVDLRFAEFTLYNHLVVRYDRGGVVSRGLLTRIPAAQVF